MSTLNAEIDWVGGLTISDGVRAVASRYGTGPTPDGSWLLTNGTGAGQANQVYELAAALAATTYLDVDLKGGGGELDVLNLPLAMTAVKSVELVVTTARGSAVSLRVGPQGRTNAAPLWWQAATANFWAEVRSRYAQQDEYQGWALDGTHKVLSLYNPNAAPVNFWLRVIGTK